MKISKFNLNKELVSYASAFVSFILLKIDVKQIILFGSVARGEADSKSDIDIFIETNHEKQTKKTTNKQLEKFYKSKIAERWILNGIKNPIKIQIGNLNKWKLKRSIISNGIVLYGEYKEMPKRTQSYTYFKINPIKNITKRNQVLRKLFGRKEKNYKIPGILNKVNGKKLSPLSFIVPLKSSQEIINLLNNKKIDYIFFEFWTDELV